MDKHRPALDYERHEPDPMTHIRPLLSDEKQAPGQRLLAFSILFVVLLGAFIAVFTRYVLG